MDPQTDAQYRELIPVQNLQTNTRVSWGRSKTFFTKNHGRLYVSATDLVVVHNSYRKLQESSFLSITVQDKLTKNKTWIEGKPQR